LKNFVWVGGTLMLEVNGNPILADETDVIEKLRDYCSQNGVNLFRVIKPTGRNNIMVNCPFHKDGQERRPSFGISRVDGMCHCFTCGWAGPFDEMVSNILGYDDAGAYGRKWLARNFLTLSLETREPLNLPLSRNVVAEAKPTFGFTEKELQKYRYYHPYMYQRGLTDEIINMFDVGYDPEFKLKDGQGIVSVLPCITFPVYNLNGSPAFIARRAIKTKFFHYPSGSEKPLYAAERLISGNYSEVIIAESILNALSCWKVGRPAVAMLGTGTEYQYQVLRSLPVRKYIIGTDSDQAGRRAANTLHQQLKLSKIITFFTLPPGKDLNDLGDKILNLPEHF